MTFLAISAPEIPIHEDKSNPAMAMHMMIKYTILQQSISTDFL